LFEKAAALKVDPHEKSIFLWQLSKTEALMSTRKSKLPELILARLALGSVPIDGAYWFDRPGPRWIDRSRDRTRPRRDERRHDDTD
jgi:hypothetical protein